MAKLGDTAPFHQALAHSQPVFTGAATSPPRCPLGVASVSLAPSGPSELRPSPLCVPREPPCPLVCSQVSRQLPDPTRPSPRGRPFPSPCNPHMANAGREDLIFVSPQGTSFVISFQGVASPTGDRTLGACASSL